MGGDLSPPIGGGQMGGDEAYMGGDLRVNFPTFFSKVFFLKMTFGGPHIIEKGQLSINNSNCAKDFKAK